jgi:hypothetical protein
MPIPIKIAAWLRPYSSLPGEMHLLPASSCCLQVFPALLRVIDLSKKDYAIIAEIELGIQGPLHHFTVMVDLENPSIIVWGEASNGFLRYRIRPLVEQEGCIFTLEKCPEDKLPIRFTSTKWKCSTPQDSDKPYHPSIELYKKESLIFSKSPVKSVHFEKISTGMERLSLGSHKSQDWNMICRRKNPSEIFPLWYSAAQRLCGQIAQEKGGAAVFLENCSITIESKKNTMLCNEFMKLFQRGFQGFFVPQIDDRLHQGFAALSFPPDLEFSPLALLQESSQLIRRLFIEIHGRELYFLPNLPPEFHCGRFLGIACGLFGTLDMEWSKKKMKRAVLKIIESGTLVLHFAKPIKQCRLRRGDKDCGQVLMNSQCLEVSLGETLYLDRFIQ